ncbi:MAG: TetR/AcrR family transcriptional regulator [Spirochaetaceae bacterium]|jgi:AcrR family transcriptional regulator|nr:TetR/AcrR family transcriptional regulator [Spirochaetaceae bacterium]
MPNVVAHDKRRKLILQRAVGVFMREGYEGTTLQKIADSCDITRTTLYQYFRNKREIFIFSIRQLLSDVNGDILTVMNTEGLGAAEQIKNVLNIVLDRLEENEALLFVLIDYLRFIGRNGVDPAERVRRRTMKMRHYLAGLVIKGMKNGELRKGSVKEACALLYGIIENTVFHLIVLQEKDTEKMRSLIDFTVDHLLVYPKR